MLLRWYGIMIIFFLRIYGSKMVSYSDDILLRWYGIKMICY